MATPPRTLLLRNTTSRAGTFAVFLSFPLIYGENVGRMQTAAYIVTHLNAGASTTLSLDAKTYAWFNTYDRRVGAPSPGTVLRGGIVHPVALGTATRAGSTFRTAFRRGASTMVLLDSAAAPGQFLVHAQTEAPKPEMMGIAKKGSDGRIVPVVTVPVSEGFSYSVAPVEKWYVARVPEETQVGQVTDLRALRRKAAVDFTETEEREVVIEELESGKFGVEFGGPSTAGEKDIYGEEEEKKWKGEAEDEQPASLTLKKTDLALKRNHSTSELSPRRTGSEVAFGRLAGSAGRWFGEVQWPDTSSTTVVVQGIGMMIDTLAPKYNWSVTTTQTAEGGVAMKINFWLRDGIQRQPAFVYRDDWRSAVAVSLSPDGHLDLGCYPTGGVDAAPRMALAGTG